MEREPGYKKRMRISKEIEKLLIENDVNFYEFKEIVETLKVFYERRAYIRKRED
nr:MAG TPA: Signal recognition particle receptor FtsY binding protein.65A [Caudoviricetes sp.]